MKQIPSNNEYERITKETAESLQKAAKSITAQNLTKLSLPEVDAVVDLVARIIPAGNVPGMILSGLSRISGNQIQPQKARQDVNILFKEVSHFIDRAKFSAFFGGPAAIIWGYQNLLKLAGKDPDSAFPEGVWQFYVDYALREDTARHTNETHGFDTLLTQNHINLNEIDRATAWVMAAVTCIHQYPSLLASEWYERTALWLLEETTNAQELFQEWEKQKPYKRDAEGATYDYPAYRRLKFEQHLKNLTRHLPQPIQDEWKQKLQDALNRSLPAYQNQMSILAYLDPGAFNETRTPYALNDALIGLIYKGAYFTLPACEPGTHDPLDVRTARTQIAKIWISSPREPAGLRNLTRLKRTEMLALRKKFSSPLQKDIEKIRYAPILINMDRPLSAKRLSDVRQGERGIGDHALTIFDTGTSFVFDQSHIFFDGAWGAALAEILTNEALSWAAYLNLLSPATTNVPQYFTELHFPFEQTDRELTAQAPSLPEEASAENNKVDIQACRQLRKFFLQRNDLLKLTINDFLILYRAIHAVTYRPSKTLMNAVSSLPPEPAEIVLNSFTALQDRTPSILIPVDASKRVPRDRVYPLNIEVPLAALGLLELHDQTMDALAAYESDQSRYSDFEEQRRTYLATLGGFGTILAKAKGIAVKGESASVGAIKLLAHLPSPIRLLLDKVPAQYEELNNMLKGNEVMSNLGAAAKGSTLTRFMTAKDDNEQKDLCWGIMTNAKGIMTIILRDFRPHISALLKIGRKELADQITQEYLDTYSAGLNQYVQQVTRIAVTRQPNDPDRKNEFS